MTKEFKTSKGEFLAVLLPDDAKDFQLIGNTLCYMVFDDFERKLPKGKYEIIGLLSKITEEQSKEVVEGLLMFEGVKYHDYKSKEVFTSYYTLESAIESFNSLMQANEIYSVNPYKNREEEGWLNDIEYQQAQENTGNWLILNKI